MSITADHPHVQTTTAPEPVPPELVVLRLDVFQPLRFRQAVVPVRKAAETVGVSAKRGDVFLARATYVFNSAYQPILHCPFPCHRSLPAVAR